ncbi:MAG: L,D-transpeptidase family protein [Eubacteriales bacterium]|nr:L,D-transpeptidase family protein [Eubacteriales bacterium]
MRKFIYGILTLAVTLSLVFAGTAFADPGDPIGPGSGNPASGASMQSGILGSNTAYNGSTSYEQGRVVVDEILGVTPDLHVQFKTGDGNLTNGFTTTMDWFDSPLDGFSGLQARLEYTIGDVYYRVRTEEHGWTRWAMNSMDTDWFNDAAKVTAVQIRTKGHVRNLYDVYYRVKLNDGTVLDWAHDGQTAGTIGTGLYIQSMQVKFWKHDLNFYEPTANHLKAAAYEGIVFNGDGTVGYSTADGSAYTGWAYDTYNNKYYFVDSAAVKDWQYIDGYKYYFDESYKVVTDLEPVIGLTGDYIMKVNKTMKTMTIYTSDGANGYIIPYKVFLCTIGSATPIGEFKTYEPHRWKFMHDNIYVQYLLRYKEKGFCIHSIIYYPEAGSYHLRANSYNELGKNQSDGCIRLKTDDCLWVYTNFGVGRKVVIYENEWVMGPFDRPCIEQAIPITQNWDPTDPVVQADIANMTGPFTDGVKTVAYKDEYLNLLSRYPADMSNEVIGDILAAEGGAAQAETAAQETVAETTAAE